MAFDDLEAEISLLMDEAAGDGIADKGAFLERLREAIHGMMAMGQTPPANLVALQERLEREMSGQR